MAGKGELLCPECRFPNLPGSVACLQCKTVLRDEAAEVLGYLCCDPFEPLVLKDGVQYSIGRAKTCDLTLPHNTLSRRHALVSVSGGKVLFEDRSSNGSSLNGRRVKEAVLEIGDVLTLGPYELLVRASPEEEAMGDGTVALDFDSRITGHIEDEPLLQTLQALEFNNRTGTLEILSGRERGTLVLSSGQPCSAELGETKDEEAVFRMLGLKEGRFTFIPGPDPEEHRMSTKLTGLLLEYSRRSDELAPPTLLG